MENSPSPSSPGFPGVLLRLSGTRRVLRLARRSQRGTRCPGAALADGNGPDPVWEWSCHHRRHLNASQLPRKRCSRKTPSLLCFPKLRAARTLPVQKQLAGFPLKGRATGDPRAGDAPSLPAPLPCSRPPPLLAPEGGGPQPEPRFWKGKISTQSGLSVSVGAQRTRPLPPSWDPAPDPTFFLRKSPGRGEECARVTSSCGREPWLLQTRGKSRGEGMSVPAAAPRGRL